MTVVGWSSATGSRPEHRRKGWRVAAAVLIFAVGCGLVGLFDDGFLVSATRLLDGCSDIAARSSWPALAVVVALSTGHYLAAAVAARTVSGARLSFGETLLVQLAAAAANRLTPAGVGGAAVLSRFFCRRAAMPLARSVGAVSALMVLGGVADLLMLLIICVFGSVVGLGGGAAELARLAGSVAAALTMLGTWWPAVASVVAVGALVITLRVQRRSRSAPGRVTSFLAPFHQLGRAPRALVTALLASGSTTLILGLGFAATTWVLPGGRGTATVGALVVGYMVASAATGVLPVPAGLGTAEAAMTAVLIGDHMTAPHALGTVLVFRAVTYWLPAAVGLLAAARLRAVGAL